MSASLQQTGLPNHRNDDSKRAICRYRMNWNCRVRTDEQAENDLSPSMVRPFGVLAFMAFLT
nr:H470 [uncultured bacterium]